MSAKRWQTGASLVEILIFLVISLLVIAAVIGLGVKVFTEQDEADTIEMVTKLRVETDALFGSKRNYGNGDLIPVLMRAGDIPESMQVLDGSGNLVAVMNPFGGFTTVNGAGVSYTVQMSGIPKRSCLRMINATRMGWSFFTVNGNSPLSALASTNAISADCAAMPEEGGYLGWMR